MEEASTYLPASAEHAFRLVEDPKSFQYLIAGARRVRRFDPRWPDPGTSLQHTSGVPPLLVRDRTEVVSLSYPTRLCMRAHLSRLGTLAVEFRFEPDGRGTMLVVSESVESGLLSHPWIRPLVETALYLRNRETCRRYRRLVQRRDRAAGVRGG